MTQQILPTEKRQGKSVSSSVLVPEKRDEITLTVMMDMIEKANEGNTFVLNLFWSRDIGMTWHHLAGMTWNGGTYRGKDGSINANPTLVVNAGEFVGCRVRCEINVPKELMAGVELEIT